MKKSFLTILFTLIFLGSFAQPPQSINYQGVARDSLGHPLLNRNVSLRLCILDSSSTGQEIYSETHSTQTSGSGLFNIYIGNGTVSLGNFESILWGQGSKWLKVEMDVSGGSNYVLLGVTQFLSVPYSLFSKNSGPKGGSVTRKQICGVFGK